MSKNKTEELLCLGVRLAQERKRLGYTQSTLADLLGKSSVTQFKYESGETRPDAEYFFALNELGADIHYIITGEQLEALKKEDERQLVSGYRSLDDQEKNLALNIMKVIAQSDGANKKNTATKKSGKK